MRRWLALVLSLSALPPLTAATPLKVEPAKAVSHFSLAMPHAKFTLISGAVARVFDGNTCVGFCFQGDGSLAYTSKLPTEAPVLAYNLSRYHAPEPVKAEGGLRTGTAFRSAMFWLGGRSLPPFPGSDAPALDGAFQALSQRFDSDGITPGLDAVLEYQANGRPLPYLQADLDNGTDSAPMVYELDPYHARTESLYLLSREHMTDPALKGMYDPIPLSSQPTGWELHTPVPGEYMLRDVALDLTQTAPLQGTLKVKETLQVLSLPLRCVRMNLDRDHWGHDGMGLVLHQERLAKVLDGQGHALPFTQDASEIFIYLPEAAQPGSDIRLSFELDGDFLVPPTNGNYWQLGTTAWFPQPDLNGQMYTWDAIVRVKKPWLAFSCGDTVRRWEEDGYAAVETKSDKPIAFGVILAGDYAIQRETRDGRTVEIATYGSSAQFSKALVDIAFQTLKYYEAFLGPYPYKEFHILEKNEWGYGQAPASIMFITKEAFNSTISELNQAIAVDVRHRFVHEIAHQWWGTVVKMPSYQEQWLTESFADACASLCLQDWPQGAAKSDYARLIATWKSDASYASTKATIPTGDMVRDPNGYDQFHIRTGLIYAKGAWLLYCIRKEIGDDAFVRFLKSYQTNFRWKFGSTQDVAGLLSFMTKKDWGPWFEQNYWGTGMPEAKP